VTESISAIVLAAGFGRRMQSDLPKVLHQCAGKPILAHVVDAASPLAGRTVVVVPPEHGAIRTVMAETGLGHVTYAIQPETKGTADAARIGLEALGQDSGRVLILPGDHPLLESRTLSELIDLATSTGSAAAVLSCRMRDPSGRGRIVRDADGSLLRIIEDRDADEDQRRIDEVNGGIYVFDIERLDAALGKVHSENSQGERYLPDVIELLRDEGETVLAHMTHGHDCFGVNSRTELSEAAGLLRDRTCSRLMDAGVTIVDPVTTYIDASVRIEPDVRILPFTFLEGDTHIERGAEIGPHARLVDSTVEQGATVTYAVVRSSSIGPRVSVGPFVSLRPGTELGAGAHIGTFVETKKAVVGEGSKVPHLSYVGDAEIGRDVNVGAGTITCNWDGTAKHRTVVEDEAYISSDTMLVAPIRIGKRAATGAGSVVRDDVPDGALAVGVPARILEGKGDRMKKGRAAPDEEPPSRDNER
jgi:bifunctional UDP-N-acetylglucosamine pyrophosphorylase / glucosamine-1-phosphate N-acetyltransferase